jgi:flagellar biosynthesis protein FlhG
MAKMTMRMPGQDTSPKRFITIGGGKGGVGKSIVASNLALAIAQTGARVVLVDCDLGAANQHVLFGVDRPKPGIQGLLDRKIDSLDEGLTPTPHPNLSLVAGTGAAMGAANINHGEKQRVIRRIRAITADVVLIDVGAGVSFNVLDFFEIGSQRLLVVTPQVTSIQTAYSFLKGSVLRTLHHHAEKASELELLAPASKSGENEKVSQILARVREQSPALADSIDHILANFGAQLVGNQVFESSQNGIFHAITRMIQSFLGITVPILGTIHASRRIRESVNLRKPMLLGGQADDDTRTFHQMAEALLAEDIAIDDLLAEDSARHVLEAAGAGAEEATRATAGRGGAGAGAGASRAEFVSSDGERGTAAAARTAPPTVPSAPPAPDITATASTSSTSPTTGDEPGPAQPVEMPSMPRQTLNAMLDPYMRRSPRVEVDWMGSLRASDGIRPVRIFEVSDGGAIVETAQSLEIGQELTLVFEQVLSQPQTRVMVKRRSTNGFVLEGDIPPAVMAAATLPGAAVRRMAG